MLFEPDFMRKLEHVSLVVRRAFPGVMKGEKRSPKRGTSVEFADFREYTPGDDFRYVDWNVYGRLDKLFLKMFVEEEDLHGVARSCEVSGGYEPVSPVPS